MDALLLFASCAIVGYVMWRHSREYKTLLDRHNHVCTITACILLVHGEKTADGKHMLTAPAGGLREGCEKARLSTMVVSNGGVVQDVGLSIEVLDDRKPRGKRDKREIEPVRLESDVQAALA